MTDLYRFRYEAPVAPNPQIFQETAVEAFPIAIVGFAVAFSVAKVYSIKHDYTIDGNQVGNNSATCRLTSRQDVSVISYLCDPAPGADSLWSQQHLWSFLQVFCSEYSSF